MTNAEYVRFHNNLYAGKTIERTELRDDSNGEQYMRWHFTDGWYTDWHISMFRGSSQELQIPSHEGRLFKEDEHVTG